MDGQTKQSPIRKRGTSTKKPKATQQPDSFPRKRSSRVPSPPWHPQPAPASPPRERKGGPAARINSASPSPPLEQTGGTATCVDSVSDSAAETQKPLADQDVAALLNHQAGLLQNVLFPAQVRNSLSLEGKACITAVGQFLAQFAKDAGEAADSVERVLLQQLAVAHLKVGDMYALATASTDLEFKQLYNSMAVRLVESICKLTSTLASYRSSASLHRRRCKAELPATAGGTGNEEREVGPVAGEGKTERQLAGNDGRGCQ